MRQSKPLTQPGFRTGTVGERARSTQLAKLKPLDVAAQFSHARALFFEGRLAEAMGILDVALGLDPALKQQLRQLGSELWADGRRDAAVALLMHASRLPQSETASLIDLAGMLIEVGQWESAVGAALIAVQRQPGSAMAQGHLGSALFRLGQFQAALSPLITAVEGRPDDANLQVNLSAVLLSLGHFTPALAFSREAAQRTPGLFQAHLNASAALAGLGRLPEAEAAAREAVAAAPHNPEVRCGLGAQLLSMGSLTSEAWTLYEARLDLTSVVHKLPKFAQWRGEACAGRTVLVHAEQGLGDTLQFARYLPMVAARGARVILVVQPELRPLLKDFPGVNHLLSVGEALPAFDSFAPLLSLPGIFGTTLASIPPVVPITADPTRVERWRLPPEREGQLQVGLVWAGNRSFVHDATRSIAAVQLTPLSTVPGIRLHSLQKSLETPAPFQLLDRMDDIKSFADTAALVSGLDLVITIDSAVAHLAATMGKEVWLLSRFAGCWRWLRDREDTPWYPTMRLYRQAHYGEWGPVISRVRQDLAKRCFR